MSEKRPLKSISTLLPATQITILGSLVLILLLAMIGFAIILNRQLVVQRQSALARAEYKSVNNIAQLDREHLRLYALIQRGANGFDRAAFNQQRNLVFSRLSTLQNSYNGITSRQEGQHQLQLYNEQWAGIQTELETWAANPQNETERAKLLVKFRDLELLINEMMRATQISFENRVAEWISLSRFLANLLTGAVERGD